MSRPPARERQARWPPAHHSMALPWRPKDGVVASATSSACRQAETASTEYGRHTFAAVSPYKYHRLLIPMTHSSCIMAPSTSRSRLPATHVPTSSRRNGRQKEVAVCHLADARQGGAVA